MKKNNQAYKIRFEKLAVSEAGKKISELRKQLLGISDVQADIQQEDPTNQDPGTTLVLVLGTPAIIALAKGIPPAINELAKGIARFLSRSRGTITITDASGKVVANGISGEDAAKIAEAFLQR